MIILDELLKRNLVVGLAVGVGVALLGPAILPVILRAARPVAKTLIKSGVEMFERGREAAAEFGEFIEDTAAEAQAEMTRERQAVMAAGAAAADVRPQSVKPANDANETAETSFPGTVP